jgi:Homeodomain-like domain
LKTQKGGKIDAPIIGSRIMQGRHAKPVQITEQEAELLNRIIRQPTQPHWLVTRSKIIIGAAAGESISQQSRDLGLVRKAVQHWREKWESHGADRQAGAESDELMDTIIPLLHDDYRRGAPATFTAEQVVQIIAVACEDPQTSGYPISHWTPREVAQEVIKRGLVSRISPRQVGRFLKRGGC